MLFNTSEHPTVFLSYDEPNCDTNYAHLLTLCPTALRVHGIKGSDTAHKHVAKLIRDSGINTSHVIIVDADNIVNSDFYQNSVEIDDSIDLANRVVSFGAKNIVNGLCYGNGGIKCWPIHVLENMQTHENSNTEVHKIDFDYMSYLQLNKVGSCSVMNTTPLQAFRAGFREGVKMSQDKEIDWRNYDRLWRWMHLGSDVKNGMWAIYGARYGYYQMLRGLDYTNVRDFDYLNDMFMEKYDFYRDNLEAECNRLSNLIRIMTNDKRIGNVYSPENSKQYKDTVASMSRNPETFLKNKQKTEYDIVFISYMESNADTNFNRIQERFPRVKRLDGIKGIHKAHVEAAKLCSTDYFWVVDADAEIVDDFNFDYEIPFYEQPKVRVWRSKNPINGLIYGNGGVKLLPRLPTIHMNTDKPDMTTNISPRYEPIMVLSNITRFNTSSFNTWRSAFRECVKLASQTIDNSNETKQRLETWCTVNNNEPFGEFAIDGAIAGRNYGLKHKNDITALKKINDYNWLLEEYGKQLY